MVGRSGTKSAAEFVEAVRFAVFLGFVMLLAIFLEAMAAADRPSEFVDVGGVLDVGFFGAGEFVEELFVGLVAVLAFGVILYGAWCAALSHRGPQVVAEPIRARARPVLGALAVKRSLNCVWRSQRRTRALQGAKRPLRSERSERFADKCSERCADNN